MTTIGSMFGGTQLNEALTGRDAVTGAALTKDERNQRLSDGAGALGDMAGGALAGYGLASQAGQEALAGVRGLRRGLNQRTLAFARSMGQRGREFGTRMVAGARGVAQRVSAGASRVRAHVAERMGRLIGRPCPNGMCQGTACFVAGTLVAMSSVAQAQPIDEVEVGSRVEVTAEAESLCSHEARPDQVRVSFVFNDEQLTWDTIYLTRLMPRAEAESLGYEVGGSAWIDGAEFGSTGWAEIASIDPVDVPAGEGCVVHATNLRSSGDMIHLRLSDGTQVDGTATHRFWSVTRGDWFAARDLRVGESLRTPSGTVRVDEARVEAVLTPVFNLEVEGAHEFFVGDAEVLAHNGGNACPGVRRYQVGTYAELTAQSRPHDGLQLDHQPSHASNVRRMEIALDRQLTRLEEDALRDASTAVAVPTAWHQQNSPTYGGRNSRWRIEMDARFPLLAATRDALAMVRRASPSDRGAALQAFHQIRDRAIELGRSFRLRRR
jgi:hypothetical protein